MIPPQAPSLRRKAVYKAVYKVRPVADTQLRIKTPGSSGAAACVPARARRVFSRMGLPGDFSGRIQSPKLSVAPASSLNRSAKSRHASFRLS